MNFTRLPARSGAVIRRVLEEEPEFRQRVASHEAATEANVGRPGWLFLHRPEGWESELGRLVSEKGEIAAMAEEAAADDRAERRLQQATMRIARLEAEAAAATGRESDAAAELATARRARQAVAERAQRLEAELAEQRQVAERLRIELAAAKAAAAEAAAKAAAAEASAPVPAAAAPAEIAAPQAPPPEPAPPPPPPVPTVDVEGLRTALARAAASLDAAARAVDDAGALVIDSPESRPVEPEPEPETVVPDLAPAPAESSQAPTTPAPPPASVPRPRPSRPLGARRRPTPLPPGLLDDTVEAADHLVRAHGVVVLVDGYNATISSWPDLPLPEQRRRLVDALAELVARTGADAQVVFDGDQESLARPSPSALRPGVRVLFSPADTSADDVILELIDRTPVHRPVVVASDDRRVQDGASARGANVLTRTQLLALLRRGPSPSS